MKIYTKTGDKGETSLFGGGRVKKNDPRVAAYGEIDELNSFVGLLIADLDQADLFKNAKPSAEPAVPALRIFLQAMQNRLFDLGAELATGDASFLAKLSRRIEPADISLIEQAIDTMQAPLLPLKNFILPGGSRAAAYAHVCRSVARRAERAMLHSGETPELLITYINRVSDYFFVLARYLNYLAGVAEPEWEK